MPTIRIDDQVWAWLKQHAQPLEDTPNSVLRRIAKLREESQMSDAPAAERVYRTGTPLVRTAAGPYHQRRSPRRVYSGLTGRQLNAEWKVDAKHALFHKDGTYYNHLLYFPGALFDLNGYVLFRTEEQYRNNRHLQHGKQLHVPGGISSMPIYVRVRKPM